MADRPKEIPPMASDEPVMELEISPFEILWTKHRNAILIGSACVLIAVVGAVSWLALSYANRTASEAAFASAATVEEYRAVTEKYPKEVVAGNAYLLLAAKLRDDKKIDEANAALQEFVKTLPEHPLAPLAMLALAENAAGAGDLDKAVAELQRIADRYPNSFVAPVALAAKADLYLVNEKRDEALATLKTQQQLFPSAVSTQMMAAQIDALEGLAEPAAPEVE